MKISTLPFLPTSVRSRFPQSSLLIRQGLIIIYYPLPWNMDILATLQSYIFFLFNIPSVGVCFLQLRHFSFKISSYIQITRAVFFIRVKSILISFKVVCLNTSSAICLAPVHRCVHNSYVDLFSSHSLVCKSRLVWQQLASSCLFLTRQFTCKAVKSFENQTGQTDRQQEKLNMVGCSSDKQIS